MMTAPTINVPLYKVQATPMGWELIPESTEEVLRLNNLIARRIAENGIGRVNTELAKRYRSEFYEDPIAVFKSTLDGEGKAVKILQTGCSVFSEVRSDPI